MPTVRFPKYGLEAEVPIGATVRDASKKCGAPEGDACGGVCACSTCHVYVTAGSSLLSEQEDEEADILDKAFDVRLNSRLGCQARLQRDGVVEVEITRESYEAFLNEHPEERKKLADRAARSPADAAHAVGSGGPGGT